MWALDSTISMEVVEPMDQSTYDGQAATNEEPVIGLAGILLNFFIPKFIRETSCK